MRWLCIDPGTRRTGVAISSPEGTFSVPLRVLEHGASGLDLDELSALVLEHGVEGLVVGLPLSMDGTSTAQTLLALLLAQRIAAHFHAILETPPGVTVPEIVECASLADGCASADRVRLVRVLLWDERLSSWEAHRAAAAGAAGGRKRAGKGRPPLDDHAAAVILQSFLEANSQKPQDGPNDGDRGPSELSC